MKAKLIHYDLSKLEQIDKVLVKRLLFGYTEYSNNSKYKYKREGILKEIPHFKLTKAVIIVGIRDASKITKILRKIKAKYSLFNIEIDKSKLH